MVVATIHTDGAYAHSRNVGGWAALIDIPGDQANITYGRVKRTTSNRMELVAIIMGLRAIANKNAAVVFTDSELAVKQFNGEYEINENLDLWTDLATERERLQNVVLKHLPRNSVKPLEEADRLSKMMTDPDCKSPEWTKYGEKNANEELAEVVEEVKEHIVSATEECWCFPNTIHVPAKEESSVADGGVEETGPGEDDAVVEDEGESEAEAGVPEGELPGSSVEDDGHSGDEPADDGGDDEPDNPAKPVGKKPARKRRSKTKIG